MALTHITLASGRTIELTELRLSSTYGGMLEGYPFQRWNDLKIDGLVKEAEKAFPAQPVHLIEPVRDYPDHPAGAFGPVEVLPAVTCTGTFTSLPVDPDSDPVLHRSALTVVWFQATPAVPSDEDGTAGVDGEDGNAGLRNVRWENLAQDHER